MSWASPAVPGRSRDQASAAPPTDVKPSTGRRSRWTSGDRHRLDTLTRLTWHGGTAGEGLHLVEWRAEPLSGAHPPSVASAHRPACRAVDVGRGDRQRNAVE